MYYSRNGCRGLTASLCGVVGKDRSTRCDPGGACGLVLAGEEVVGALEGDEAAGMPRGTEYVAGVRDAHGVIGRRMHQQQGAANSLDRSRRSAERTSSMKCRLRVSALPPDEERRFTVSVDSVEKSVVVVLHVSGLERCCDAERRRHRRALVGRGYGGGPLEECPPRSLTSRPESFTNSTARTVSSTVRERHITPVTLGLAQTEVVDPQHGRPCVRCGMGMGMVRSSASSGYPARGVVRSLQRPRIAARRSRRGVDRC